MSHLKPSEVHPCPGPELERDTSLWGQKSKMQRGKLNREWSWFMQECNITFPIFLAALVSFLRTGKHFPPRHTQAMINTTGPPENPFHSHYSEAPRIVHCYHGVFPTDIMLNMNLRQWNLNNITNLTLGYGTWKEHWRMNACRTETWGADSMRHTLRGAFFNPRVCLHWWRSCPLQPMH